MKVETFIPEGDPIGLEIQVLNKKGEEMSGDRLQQYAYHNTNLVWCDLEGFAFMDEDIFLLDECGNYEYISEPGWTVRLFLR